MTEKRRLVTIVVYEIENNMRCGIYAKRLIHADEKEPKR